ncbi:16S rRNA (uracil(1498)-N(3))-methyltransferase [Mariniluteicoccus endophyticus]
MTRPLFLAPLPDPLPTVGSAFRLDGDEGRHAAVVRRITAGEELVVGDGAGRGVGVRVVAADKQGLDLEVTEHVGAPEPGVRVVAVQALAKGDRSDLAIEMLTEVGADEVVPWQANRSIVRWQGERGEKSLNKWRATVREAAKQSRRLRTPEVSVMVTTRQLAARMRETALVLVLHEEANATLADVDLPAEGEVMLVVGPEGGIAPEELEAFVASGARTVLVNDGVLRTSTAGAVAVGWVRLRPKE